MPKLACVDVGLRMRQARRKNMPLGARASAARKRSAGSKQFRGKGSGKDKQFRGRAKGGH